jgi:hypothetical protein
MPCGHVTRKFRLYMLTISMSHCVLATDTFGAEAIATSEFTVVTTFIGQVYRVKNEEFRHNYVSKTKE